MPEEGPRLRLRLGAKEASEVSAWPKPTKVIPLGRHTDTLRVSEDQVNAEAGPRWRPRPGVRVACAKVHSANASTGSLSVGVSAIGP